MFTAEKGSGAWLNDRRLRVSDRREMTEVLLATGIPFGHRSGDLPRMMRELAQLMPRTAGVRRWGAASLDLAYVAAGRYDGFWEASLKPWDIAAGLLLVREAGGLVSELDGGEDVLSTGSVLATNEKIHDTLAQLIRGA